MKNCSLHQIQNCIDDKVNYEPHIEQLTKKLANKCYGITILKDT